MAIQISLDVFKGVIHFFFNFNFEKMLESTPFATI